VHSLSFKESFSLLERVSTLSTLTLSSYFISLCCIVYLQFIKFGISMLFCLFPLLSAVPVAPACIPTSPACLPSFDILVPSVVIRFSHLVSAEVPSFGSYIRFKLHFPVSFHYLVIFHVFFVFLSFLHVYCFELPSPDPPCIPMTTFPYLYICSLRNPHQFLLHSG
jgi:hypothetical protein